MDEGSKGLENPIAFSVQHSPQTIRRLSYTQYDAFHWKKKAVQILAGVLCILVGTRLLGDVREPYNYLFSLYGCFSLLWMNMPAKRRADKIIESIDKAGGHYPRSIFRFDEKDFRVTAKGHPGPGERHAYSQCYTLMEDRAHYYYFINRDAAFLFPKADINVPLETFRVFLESKTGLRFRRANRWWNASLWSLLQSRRNIRKTSA